MLEKNYTYSIEDTKIVEKLVDNYNTLINHMVFPMGGGLPEHYSNSNVYMIVIRGNLTLQLDEQEPHKYAKGQIVNIPYKTKMIVNNFDDEVLEFFVIKAPNPKHYQEHK